MGYDVIPGSTRDNVVQELLANFSPRDHELRNDSLWAVLELVDSHCKERLTIVCFRLSQFPKGWGYKQIDERMHPFYYDCPLRLLKLAPVACESWRKKVVTFHVQTLL